MAESALLRWANKLTRGHDHVRPVDDLTTSWADGTAFCALIYAYNFISRYLCALSPV